MIVKLIETLKDHDTLCRNARRGVGRTGELLAHAMEKAVEHFAEKYDYRLDDGFLDTISGYAMDVGISQSQTSSGAVSASSSSSGSNAAGKEEEKGGITAFASVTSSPRMGPR